MIDGFDSKADEFPFELTANGERFATTLSNNGEYLDEAYWTLIDRIIAGTTKGKLYSLEATPDATHEGMSTRLIYLTPEQHKSLTLAGALRIR